MGRMGRMVRMVPGKRLLDGNTSKNKQSTSSPQGVHQCSSTHMVHRCICVGTWTGVLHDTDFFSCLVDVFCSFLFFHFFLEPTHARCPHSGTAIVGTGDQAGRQHVVADEIDLQPMALQDVFRLSVSQGGDPNRLVGTGRGDGAVVGGHCDVRDEALVPSDGVHQPARVRTPDFHQRFIGPGDDVVALSIVHDAVHGCTQMTVHLVTFLQPRQMKRRERGRHAAIATTTATSATTSATSSATSSGPCQQTLRYRNRVQYTPADRVWAVLVQQCVAGLAVCNERVCAEKECGQRKNVGRRGCRDSTEKKRRWWCTVRTVQVLGKQ